MAKQPPSGKKIEFEPDAWQRFEGAIDVVVKSPPQHRTSAPKKKKTPKKRKATRK